MTVSGEHDSDAYNFVDCAMTTVKAAGLSKVGCYYFFQRCEAHPEVDVSFSVEMDESLTGNTDSVFETNSTTTSRSLDGEKKRAYAAIVDVSAVASSIASEMKETNRLARESFIVAQDAANELKQKNLLAKAKNNLAKQSQMITLAQHLGKNDLLEQILASMDSKDDD